MKNVIFIILIYLLSSCKEKTPGTSTGVTDPSGLNVKTVIAPDSSGDVMIIATAKNSVSYEFDTGVDEIFSDTTGTFTYTYETSGIYQIEVKAYGSSGRFIKKSSQLTVYVSNSNAGDSDGYTSPISYTGKTLIWNDEFSGSALSESDWNYEIGTGSGGWGNNELQYYRKENTSVFNGYLTIEAKKQNYESQFYTSSRLTTQNKFGFRYGRVDIRAKLPYGQGLWPALWMLGSNINTVGWPSCGEIDIMELVGGEGDNEIHGTLHWNSKPNNANPYIHTHQGESTELLSGIFNDNFHVFSIEWTPTEIRWYLDTIQYSVIETTSNELSEFKNEFFLIFNVAVGGNFPGSPNSSTVFPQQMVVDYVRVFQDNE